MTCQNDDHRRDRSYVLLHCVSKNVTTLVVNNFYKLEPILIIFMLKLLASKRM